MIRPILLPRGNPVVHIGSRKAAAPEGVARGARMWVPGGRQNEREWEEVSTKFEAPKYLLGDSVSTNCF